MSTLLALRTFWIHFAMICSHFGISLVSFFIHFGIILEVSVRHRKSIHFGAFQGSGLGLPLTGNFLVKALKMEMTVLTRDFLVEEVLLSKTCEDIKTGSAIS